VTYSCTCCGEVHDDLPDLTFGMPAHTHHIPESERPKRVKIDSDLCSVDGEEFFIRGVLRIPIVNHTQDLGFGVWVSRKKENFQTYVENFDSAEIGPFFGWLSNEFNFGGQPTLNLKTMVHFQGKGIRPLTEYRRARFDDLLTHR
jgi:hypothetical protein